MSESTLAIEHAGAVTRVWLNRPERLNALNTTALEELHDTFATLQARHETRVVILGGRGRAFCAGADRKDPPARFARGAAAGSHERRWASHVGRRAMEAIERLEVITIARLHGHVVGGGLVLALACDLRVAAASTSFHIPEVDLGVPLTWGAVPRLAREIGPARAKELILLCDRFDGQAAAGFGLINRVVPDERLDVVVDEWAERLAAKPDWALHMTKNQFQAYGHAMTLGDVTRLDGDLLIAASSEDPTRFAFPPKS